MLSVSCVQRNILKAMLDSCGNGNETIETKWMYDVWGVRDVYGMEGVEANNMNEYHWFNQ